MAQATIAIANGDGATVRAAVNSALEAITTKQSGGTAPSTTYPFMEWADTANDLLKQRNAANSAWIIKGTLSAEYGGIPASGISYDPGSPALLNADNMQEAIDELAADVAAIPEPNQAPRQTTYATNADLATDLPDDDTIPTSTEGDQVMSDSITPSSASKRIKITVSVFGSSADPFAVSLFRGSTILNVFGGRPVNSSSMATVSFSYIDSPASTSALTYSVRAGGAANVLRLNGTASARRFGGAAACSMILEEID